LMFEHNRFKHLNEPSLNANFDESLFKGFNYMDNLATIC